MPALVLLHGGGSPCDGSCVTMPMITAWGTSYVISGPNRLSFVKNGAYYDVDQGVEPDYVISTFDRYYDREALAEYIRGLFWRPVCAKIDPEAGDNPLPLFFAVEISRRIMDNGKGKVNR